MVYTLTCSPALDYTLTLPAPLAPGGLNRAAQFGFEAGGKGINVSRVLKNLGAESRALGFVSGFTGREIKRRLGEAGIGTDFIDLDGPDTRVNVKILDGDGRETEVNGPGALVTQRALAALTKTLRRTVAPGDYLVLSGMPPENAAEDFYAGLIALANGAGALAALDFAGTAAAYRAALKERPYLIKPNLAELERAVCRRLDGEKAAAAAARELSDAGAGRVFVTLGGAGALFIGADRTAYRYVPPAGKPINAVGAGDSAVAGFIAARLEGLSEPEAFYYGCAAGTATAYGMGLAQREAVDRIFSGLPEMTRIQ
ncbi:MAG: 1-phosphofructokinase family hexose kinase [Clostridiales bacterium]|nr:1-phosphofructokinase family hexose kinase [Clostridiales bacterium]